MNLYAAFKRVFPDPPLQVATVIAVDSGTITAVLPGGGQLRARGVATISEKVFIRDGVIESTAPDLTIEIIEI